MGSSMKDIYDDYQDYTALCEEMNTSPLPMRDASTNGAESWYDDWEKLKKKNKKK